MRFAFGAKCSGPIAPGAAAPNAPGASSEPSASAPIPVLLFCKNARRVRAVWRWSFRFIVMEGYSE